MKFFLFTKDTRTGFYYIIELEIDKDESRMAVKTKARDEKSAALFNIYVTELLRMNELIE